MEGLWKMNEQQIKQLIYEDEWMMAVLKEAALLNLPDCWVCAGFVRAKIWDVLHGYARTILRDVDVIYFDRNNCDEQKEKALEAVLRARMEDVIWSVKNQARMHEVKGVSPYLSSTDAVAKFPETATALAVRLVEGELELMAPHGLEDVVNLIVRPTSFFKESPALMNIYHERLLEKDWLAHWIKLRTVHETAAEALDAYIVATNSHDFRHVAQLLHERSVYYFSNKTCETKAEIGAYFTAAWQHVVDEHYEAVDRVWLCESVCLYTYRYSGFVDGEYVTGSGRATNVFEKVGDTWLLLHEHLSANPR